MGGFPYFPNALPPKEIRLEERISRQQSLCFFLCRSHQRKVRPLRRAKPLMSALLRADQPTGSAQAKICFSEFESILRLFHEAKTIEDWTTGVGQEITKTLKR